MAAVCPSCGVAVVPGYVRCPKCHGALPATRRGAPTLGGTSVQRSGKLPLIALGMIAAGVVIVAYVGARGGGSHSGAPGTTAGPTGPLSAPPPAPTTGRETGAAPAATPTAPSPDATAGELERDLKRQHLWSTVEIVGGHVDVRSGSCGDPALRAATDGAVTAFRAAGLTKLRCVELSGRLVFERAL